MHTLTLKMLTHRNAEHIGIYFTNRALNNTIKKLKGIKWSQTHKCWYMPLNQQSHTALVKAIGNTAIIDASLLKAYLVRKKQGLKKRSVFIP